MQEKTRSNKANKNPAAFIHSSKYFCSSHCELYSERDFRESLHLYTLHHWRFAKINVVVLLEQ